MLKLTGWRLARTIPLLFLVSLAVFGLVYLIPGDPASAIAGDGATPQQIAAIRQQLGLDQSIFVQYGDWVGHFMRGDFGQSFYSGVPVAQSIGERFPVTLSLAAAALFVALIVGIPAGIWAATRRGEAVDRVVTMLSTFGIAIPAFWLGLLLIIAFALQLHLFPAVGYVPLDQDIGGWLLQLTLPAVTLGAAGAAELARHTRSALRRHRSSPRSGRSTNGTGLSVQAATPQGQRVHPLAAPGRGAARAPDHAQD